jgi:hypothetical protein
MAKFAKHGTLVANAVTTITLNDGQFVEVVNRSGSAEIFFNFYDAQGIPGVTIPGEALAAIAAPTVAGDDSYIVPAVAGESRVEPCSEGPITVQLISTGTPTFSVITGTSLGPV